MLTILEGRLPTSPTYPFNKTLKIFDIRSISCRNMKWKFWISETKKANTKKPRNQTFFYFQVRESPAPLNIPPTPTPAPDHSQINHLFEVDESSGWEHLGVSHSSSGWSASRCLRCCWDFKIVVILFGCWVLFEKIQIRNEMKIELRELGSKSKLPRLDYDI